jgi:hypothetical protein
MLSDIVGVNSIGWRYDPIFISEKYTAEYHLRAFEQMATALDGYTKTAVISFIDLYPKVKRNFPEAKEVTVEERLALGKAFIRIAAAHGMTVKPCAEGDELAEFGADCSGCMKISDYEKAIGKRLNAPKRRAQGLSAPAIFPAISALITPAGTYVNIAMQMQSRQRFWSTAVCTTPNRRS